MRLFRMNINNNYFNLISFIIKTLYIFVGSKGKQTTAQRSRKMKMPSKKITNFLTYEFHGNGKYRTLTQGSKRYNSTEFAKFYNKHPSLVKVLSSGNDAPRGGQTGNFMAVEFTPEFFEVTKPWFDLQDSIAKRKVEIAAEREENEKIISEEVAKLMPYANAIRERINASKSLLGAQKSEVQSDLMKEILQTANHTTQNFWAVWRAIN